MRSDSQMQYRNLFFYEDLRLLSLTVSIPSFLLSLTASLTSWLLILSYPGPINCCSCLCLHLPLVANIFFLDHSLNLISWVPGSSSSLHYSLILISWVPGSSSSLDNSLLLIFWVPGLSFSLHHSLILLSWVP